MYRLSEQPFLVSLLITLPLQIYQPLFFASTAFFSEVTELQNCKSHHTIIKVIIHEKTVVTTIFIKKTLLRKISLNDPKFLILFSNNFCQEYFFKKGLFSSFSRLCINLEKI